MTSESHINFGDHQPEWTRQEKVHLGPKRLPPWEDPLVLQNIYRSSGHSYAERPMCPYGLGICYSIGSCGYTKKDKSPYEAWLYARARPCSGPKKPEEPRMRLPGVENTPGFRELY